MHHMKIIKSSIALISKPGNRMEIVGPIGMIFTDTPHRTCIMT